MIPLSGAITMSMIVTEFGGTAPHSLSEYYGRAPGLPESGQIKYSDFRGKSFTRVSVPSNGISSPNTGGAGSTSYIHFQLTAAGLIKYEVSNTFLVTPTFPNTLQRWMHFGVGNDYDVRIIEDTFGFPSNDNPSVIRTPSGGGYTSAAWNTQLRMNVDRQWAVHCAKTARSSSEDVRFFVRDAVTLAELAQGPIVMSFPT